MKPAVVTLKYRYELNAYETNEELLECYNYCLQEYLIKMQMRFGNQLFMGNFKKFPIEVQNELRQCIYGPINELSIRLKNHTPYFSDISNELILENTSIRFKIIDAYIEGPKSENNYLKLYLYFISKPVTLLDSLENKLVISISNYIGNELSNDPSYIFFVEHTPDITFERYER